MHVSATQSWLTFRDTWTATHQAPQSMGFSRQDYWAEWHSLPQGILLTHGLNLHLLLWSCFGFQFSSVTQSSPALCDPMNCSMPGLPVHHQLLEFTQIHVHRYSDAIQPSHPLSSPSPALNLSQHQGLFK